MEEEQQINIYLPASNLQGQDTPFYALWDTNKNYSIKIELPNGLSLKELYNVSEDAIQQLTESSVLIKKCNINGYIGGLITSNINNDSAQLLKSIKVSLMSGEDSTNKLDSIESFEPEIELFRPDVKLISVPAKILVTKNNKGKIETDNKIILSNLGKGMGLISIEIKSSEQLKETYSEGAGAFIEGLIYDLKQNLGELKVRYSAYSDVIDSLIQFLEKPTYLTKEEREAQQRLVSRFRELVDSDEGFKEEIAFAVNKSILKNAQILISLSSFVAYIKSGLSGKIMNLDALRAVEIKKGEVPIQINLKIIDLGGNLCSEIRVPEITVATEESYIVPFYELFGVSYNGGNNNDYGA